MENYDVIGVSETWLRAGVGDDVVNIPGYGICRCDREFSGGGGVALYMKNNIRMKILLRIHDGVSESIYVLLSVGRLDFVVGVAYRRRNINCNDFIDNLESALAEIYCRYDRLWLMGDMNSDLFLDTEQSSKLIPSSFLCLLIRIHELHISLQR